MSYTITGTVQLNGVGQNAIPIAAWKASRFGSPPAYNASPPSGTADATSTSGTGAGSPGGYSIDVPTNEPYYIQATMGGNNYWMERTPVVFADGTSGDQGVPVTDAYLAANYAPLTSPTLQGTPVLANTPGAGDNSFKIADTAFVTTAVASATGLKTATTTVSVSGAAAPANGAALTATSGTTASWITPPAGTVTTASVVSANGFAGSVTNPTTAPAITIDTTVTGVLKGSGGSLAAATAGTDYVIPSGSITGNAATATAAAGLQTSSGTVSVSAATAPASPFGQVLTATSATTATWQTPTGGGGSSWTGDTRTASGTMTANERCFFTGTTAGQTLSLPSAPSASTDNSVTNISTQNVTIARSGTDTLQHYLTNTNSIVIPPGMGIEFIYIGTTWYVVPGTGFVPGMLLAQAQYAPASLVTYNVTATTATALDTTNLTFSPVVPPNGKLLLSVGADYYYQSISTPAWDAFLGFVKHNTTTVVGVIQSIQGASNGAQGLGMHGKLETVATGQTPGALPLDVAGAISLTGQTFQVYAENGGTLTGDPAGPILMTAYALP